MHSHSFCDTHTRAQCGMLLLMCLHAPASHLRCICCLPLLPHSVKAAYTRKLLSHPHNPASKELISSRYGIPLAAPRSLPAPLYRELEVEVVGSKPLTGPTVNQLAAVPHSKRQGGTVCVCSCVRVCVCACVRVCACSRLHCTVCIFHSVS